MNTFLQIAAWLTVILLSIAFGVLRYRVNTRPGKPFRRPKRQR